MVKNMPEIGEIVWNNFSQLNARKIKQFYSKVVGWKPRPQTMGDSDDYVMLSPKTKNNISCVCHKRGSNADFRPQWLVYMIVSNLTKSISAFKKLGGKVIIKLKPYGNMGKYCVIQDPACAFCALFESKENK